MVSAYSAARFTLEHKDIREYRILPRNNEFYLELTYKISSLKPDVNIENVLSIDHGLNNWLTCVSNVGTSFLIDGRKDHNFILNFP